MAQRRHHYEVAFEDYLRRRRVPYVAVDEAKKALLPEGAPLRLGLGPAGPGGPAGPAGPGAGASPAGRSLKSFDFVLYAGAEGNLLLEVKGRRVASRSPTARARLESWVTLDDLESLSAWEALFGPGFSAAFAFVYWCQDQPPDALFQEVFEHRGRWYAVRAITLRAYRSALVTRSARWRTVHVPTSAFERLSGPLTPRAGDGPIDLSPPRDELLGPLEPFVLPELAELASAG